MTKYFIYHYYAEYRTPLEVQGIDGIAWMTIPIQGMASHHQLKKVIIKGLDIPLEKLAVHSLTPLGEIESDGKVDNQ